MLLALRVIARPEEDAGGPLVAHFDEAGGLIGRADTARLVLPDPKRTVSRFHAHIAFENGAFVVEDMGSTNPAAVNGQSLASGQRLEVKSGDRIRIGGYVLAAEVTRGDLPPDGANAHVGSEEIYAHTRIVSREQQAMVAAPRGSRVPATPEELWRAFQEGAEASVDMPDGLRVEYMRMLGAMMKSMVGGIRRLLQVRTLVKQELDADATTLRPRQNNPLKFAPDDTKAISALLKPPLPGFIAGPPAVDEVMIDLQVHAIATRLAMRAAIERVLGRFEPQALEQQLQGGGMLQRLLPGNRKARLWDLYIEQQRAIRNNAVEGFQAAFAQAFAEAYERESGRLKNGSPTRPQTVAVDFHRQ
jgi:predicted component of type VI protein secretion system